jgi:hypothetical protein
VTLTPCSDLSAARWLCTSTRPWDRLVGFGPDGLPAYARLRFIPDPSYEGQSENDREDDDDAPPETTQLRRVLETLARHTRTPQECYFCLWDGWGVSLDGAGVMSVGDGAVTEDDGAEQPDPAAVPGFAPAPSPSGSRWPKVVLPHRAYYLFHGPVSGLGEWAGREESADPHAALRGPSRAFAPDPAFVWPADHAWCVAKDVDPHWAGIGADPVAIGELLTDSRLDVVPADPDADQPRYR